MNKQELIESISHLPSDCSRPRPMIDKLTALELIKLLDEPQKVTVPQFVADYIKYALENDWDFQDLFKRIEDEEDEELLRWVYHERNQETLAAAWINGYTVEKEKRYIVKMSATKQPLFYNNMYEKTFFSLGDLATRFTRKQLEGLGLGWVFDCEGIEIEEVE
ncbi:DUF1642 domain-containing protein [Streptococcus parasanguinis]|uniref:DUF1642 domain-containing protein n=1 Tax=Streptococcus parasanguinis TaxID=1318 RepID=UPI00319DE0EC